jgi:hypothetical protein
MEVIALRLTLFAPLLIPMDIVSLAIVAMQFREILVYLYPQKIPIANPGLGLRATFVEMDITLMPMVYVLLLINHARLSTQQMETALLAL